MEQSKTNEQAFEWLIEKALVGTTKENMSLYKEYQQNEVFKADFQNLLKRTIENWDFL